MHDFAKRRDRLRKKLKLGKQEAFLITKIVNLAYLTGFSGSAGWLVMFRDRDLIISDSRYTTQLAQQCPDLEAEIRDALTSAIDNLLAVAKSAKLRHLRFESAWISKSLFDQFETKLENIELVPTTNAIEDQRAIKDKSEIEAIRDSINVNQRAFEVIRSQLTGDQTELTIAHNLEHQMRKFGAKGYAFDPIIGVGPRSALPHGFPTNTRIGDNPILLIDWGAKVHGYVSDLTRVLVTGKIPPKLRKIHNIVLKAQLAAIKKIRPGAKLKEIDLAARKVIESAGFGKYFGHGTGHGMGLEVHESPNFSPIADGKLKPGMVVTVEPGIYLPDWGGVRIEDDILVTRSGHEVLSDLPKDLEECVVDI